MLLLLYIITAYYYCYISLLLYHYCYIITVIYHYCYIITVIYHYSYMSLLLYVITVILLLLYIVTVMLLLLYYYCYISLLLHYYQGQIQGKIWLLQTKYCDGIIRRSRGMPPRKIFKYRTSGTPFAGSYLSKFSS